MRTALGLLLAAGSASAACTLAENQTGCECAAKETEPAVVSARARPLCGCGSHWHRLTSDLAFSLSLPVKTASPRTL